MYIVVIVVGVVVAVVGDDGGDDDDDNNSSNNNNSNSNSKKVGTWGWGCYMVPHPHVPTLLSYPQIQLIANHPRIL